MHDEIRWNGVYSGIKNQIMKARHHTRVLYRFILVLGFIWALAACREAPKEKPSFDLAVAEDEIASRLRAYEDALATGDLQAFGQMYTVDAEILHNGSPSTLGRESIVRVFEGMIRDSITDSGFTTTGLWGNEELLVEQGTGYFAHASGKWKSSGQYLLVWKKEDGEWRIFKDTWFADPKKEE